MEHTTYVLTSVARGRIVGPTGDSVTLTVGSKLEFLGYANGWMVFWSQSQIAKIYLRKWQRRKLMRL